MKQIRIGSGAGYGGDRIEPAIDLIKEGTLDYIIFETLAERTIALAQKEKLVDETRGYNPLMEYRFEKIFPHLKKNPVKIITNMGAANPVHAAKRIQEMANESGLNHLKIVAVTGDDIKNHLDDFMDITTMETEEPLEHYKEKIISANAYIGCEGIVKALTAGADIVITGRVSDPTLVVGPLVYEFNKSMEDYDFLGKATIAGHLLECAGQVCGGYFADPGYKEVPELWNLGFPIAEIDENGEIVITKLVSSGGLVTRETVIEQLLYEIQNPAAYFTPDVVADLSKITVEEIGKDRIRVSKITGHERTKLLKVSIGYKEGYLCESEISYGGHNSQRRAKLAVEVIQKRLAYLDYNFDEIRYDLIGVDSLYQSEINQVIMGNQPVHTSETRLRIAARTPDRVLASRLGQEVEALYTNGPAAGGGIRNHVTDIVSVISILLPESLISQNIVLEGN